MDSIEHPDTKAARQAAIRHEILTFEVSTQRELRESLKKQGFVVAQATLSRDLEEMGAYKSHEDSAYRLRNVGRLDLLQLNRVLSGLVTGVAQTENQIVIHTSIGAAQYAASAIDMQGLDGVLGTVAGNDTVLLIAASAEIAQKVAKQFLKISS